MLSSKMQDIQVGDLVEIVDWRGSPPDDRAHGVVCRRDVHHPSCDNSIILIAEVLWSSGQKGWIDEDRISVVSKERQ